MKRFVLFLMILSLLSVPFGASAEEMPEFLLITAYRQFGWGDRLEIGAVDTQGGLWTYEAETGALECPSGTVEAADFIRAMPGLTKYGTLDAEELERLTGLVVCLPVCEERAVAAANDAGTQTSWALRTGRDGVREAVVLGMSGDDLLENPDPGAQELYAVLRKLFPGVCDFDGEEPIAPKGFQSVPLADFCGYADTDFANAKVEVFASDCETGLSPTESDRTAEQLLGLQVVGKENSLCVTGGTTVYTLVGEDGEALASFEFYDGLLVRDDGMYRVK